MATNNRQESPYICMAMRLWETAEPTNTRASTARATTTRPGFAQHHRTPRTAFSTSCWLLVGTDRPAEPAHAQQPHSARAPAARRPGTAPGPAAGPFSTLPTPPLHLNPLGLGPGPPPPRLCPRGRDAATSWSKKRPIAAEKASPPDVPSGANRATDSVHLQHSDTEVNNHS